MAIYTFTASSVVGPSGGASTATAGVALNAGDLIYLDATDGSKAKLAQCDGTVAEADVVGICLNSAAAGQPVQYVSGGEITVDAATFAGAGLTLVLSPTPGGLMDIDGTPGLVTGNYLTIIGWSTATNKFKMNLAKSGLVK